MLRLFARRGRPAPPPEVLAFRVAADGILVADAGGRVTLTNPAAGDVEPGRRLCDVLHAARPCEEDCAVAASLRDGAPRRARVGAADVALAALPGGGLVATVRAAPEPEPEPPAPQPGDAVAVVRRPITGADGAVAGYELRPVTGPAADTTKATAALLLEVAEDGATERLAGRHRAWVTVTPGFLRDVGTPPLRPDRAVLQVVSTAEDDARAALERLRWSGYELALAAYDGTDALLDLCAYVTVPVHGRTDEELTALVAEPVRRGLKLVATGVGTAQELERCRALGFSLFQGDFVAKPGLVRRSRVGSSEASLRTLAELTVPDASFDDLERTISADVALSVKLLRYVNSAYFGLPRTVESVREALTLLGTATVRRWASVMVLGSYGAAPEALIDLALQRARMCEILGGAEDGSAFTVGLFSVADALLGAPMEDVLETLPFSPDIGAALLRREGAKGRLLDAVLAYERGEEAPPQAAGAYRESAGWAAEVSAAVA